MARLRFKIAEVKRVVSHALAHPTTDGGIPETPQMILVHDHGVYLMSGGSPVDPGRREGSAFVAYAEGLDPDANPDSWEDARAVVGGDDFAEFITVTPRMLEQCDQFDALVIDLTSTTMAVQFERRKRKA